MNRLGAPEEIAAAIIFLGSPWRPTSLERHRSGWRDVLGYSYSRQPTPTPFAPQRAHALVRR
jgi:hypothetical protein